MSWEKQRVSRFGFTRGVTLWFGPASNVIIVKIKIEIGRGRAIVYCFVNHRASSPPDRRRRSCRREGAARVSGGGGGSR